MKSILALTLASLAFASPVPETAVETRTAGPPSFKIKNVVSGGSGCPQGSVDINFTDSAILPIYFSKDFTASVGPDVAASESRKNCQINMLLQYSAGWSYALYSADYSGYADIEEGVKGVLKSTYYHSGNTEQTSVTAKFNGPVSGWYKKHDEIAVSVWSPCNGEAMLNVNTEVALTPLDSKNKGTIVALREQGRFTNSIYVKWRQC